MNINFKKHLQTELDTIKKDGLYKEERVIVNPQGRSIKVNTGDNVLNFCANNYLGLSSHPDVVKAAKDTLDTHGFGMSSVRFICGTQDIQKEFYQDDYNNNFEDNDNSNNNDNNNNNVNNNNDNKSNNNNTDNNDDDNNNNNNNDSN